ncbi:DUF397 domain-containing protein [Streptomyces sp. WAC08241]|uniref:DUF397 domain-containing protein n=1 Tax=Streptomyces sp. WAC08241 TaxID=2487421 RepID=UPI0037DC2373
MRILGGSTPTPPFDWFRSSDGGGEADQCVEIAAGARVVRIRDSKAVTGAVTGPVIHVSSRGVGCVRQEG